MSNARNLANLLGTGTQVTTADIADGVFQANKNLVINGAMNVAQRSTSVAGLSSTATYSTCDRWQVQYGSSGTFTESQSSTSPDGFSNSLKLDCTAEDASPDYLLICKRFEGQDLQHIQKGTSGAKSTTLSFYVRSSKTGTYQVNLNDNDNTRMIGATYTISSANTWEYKTITFAGDTTGTFDNDSSLSLQIEWWIASGSTYNSGAVPTSWEAKVDVDRAAGLNVAIGASTDDEFYITGVQLEVGETATPFEHEDYGTTLRKCQRYFELLGHAASTSGNAYSFMSVSFNGSVTNQWLDVPFKVEKRAAPTSIDSFNGYTVPSPTATGIGVNGFTLYKASQMIFIKSGGSNGDAVASVSAEL